MSLEVSIRKKLATFDLDVDFTAGSETVGFLGASGCGKSFTLRCVAGVETPDEGRIVVNGQVFFDSERKINLSPQQRKTALLFQNYQLFPNLTVKDNVGAGIGRDVPKAQRDQIVAAELKRFGLQGFDDRYPGQLSGGQQQRVALARILINEPELILLDEPFSALDSHLRDRMEREVMGILRDFGGDALIVSHSRDELYRMADNLAIYNRGRIEALGEKHALFKNPGTYTAAQLTGCKNFSRISHLRHEGGRTVFTADDWGIELSVPGEQTGEVVGLRRHCAVLADAPGPNTFAMEIVSVIEDPFEMVVFLRRPGHTGASFGWSIPKEKNNALPERDLLIRFPDEALMILRE